MRKRLMLALCAAFVLTVGVATATAGNGNGGNSANAKLCQKDGWKTVYRSDGSSFTSQDECVAYGAKGGTLLQSAFIDTYNWWSTDLSRGFAVTGTGFTPNHDLTFTATGFGPHSNVLDGTDGVPLTTDGNGAFDSKADDLHYWTVFLWCADLPETIHVTVTDGVHLGVKDVTYTSCS